MASPCLMKVRPQPSNPVPPVKLLVNPVPLVKSLVSLVKSLVSLLLPRLSLADAFS
jgi:hypothetical protein